MGLVWYGLDGMKGVCSKGNGLEGLFAKNRMA